MTSLSYRMGRISLTFCPIHNRFSTSPSCLPTFRFSSPQHSSQRSVLINSRSLSTVTEEEKEKEDSEVDEVVASTPSFRIVDRKPFPLGTTPFRIATAEQKYSATSLFTPLFNETSPSSSSNLLIRAGFIRQTAPGLYTFLPFGLRVLSKLTQLIENILESRLQAQKIDLPILTSASLWRKSNRWDQNFHELFRLQDRKGTDLLLSPSQPETITQLMAGEITSHHQMPLRLYQISKKFRDEARLKGGLIRSKEFIMNDMYSFDSSQQAALNTYETVADLYHTIFSKLGLKVVEADADSGRIGGSISHEFHIPFNGGDDTIFKCTLCKYAANAETAIGDLPAADITTPSSARPAHTNMSEENPITKFINGLIPGGVEFRKDVVRKYEVVVEVDPPPDSVAPFLPFHIVLISANRSVNPVAVKNHVGSGECRVASSSEAVKFIAAVIEQQRRKEKSSTVEVRLPRLLIDSSIVPYGVDVDWDAAVAARTILQDKKMKTKEVTEKEYEKMEKPSAEKEKYMKNLFEGLDLPSLKRSNGEVDMDSLMKKIDKLINEKGPEIMANIQFKEDAKGNAIFGEMLPPPPPASPPVVANDASIEEDERTDDSKPQNISEIEFPMQGIFRTAESGDRCLFSCRGVLQQLKGIEVAHTAYLGTRYSQPLGANFTNSKGRQKSVEMGFYGIGISRLMGAIAEVAADQHGIKWPTRIAPYQVAIIDINKNTASQTSSLPTSSSSSLTAESLYDYLSAPSSHLIGECLLDSRVNERLSIREKELRYIGIPYIITVGGPSAIEGKVEVEVRRTGRRIQCSKVELLSLLLELTEEEEREIESSPTLQISPPIIEKKVSEVKTEKEVELNNTNGRVAAQRI